MISSALHFIILISTGTVRAGPRLVHRAHEDVEEAGHDEEPRDGDEDGAEAAAVTRVVEPGALHPAAPVLVPLHLYHDPLISRLL